MPWEKLYASSDAELSWGPPGMFSWASRGYILEEDIHGKTLHGYRPKKLNQIEARFACLQKCVYNIFHFLGPWLQAFLDLKSNCD